MTERASVAGHALGSLPAGDDRRQFAEGVDRRVGILRRRIDGVRHPHRTKPRTLGPRDVGSGIVADEDGRSGLDLKALQCPQENRRVRLADPLAFRDRESYRRLRSGPTR